MQPKLADLHTDERGRFSIYGPASFVVSYNRTQNSIYELSEAVWAHWSRLRQERPELGDDDVFYWIDLFALPPAQLAGPLSTAAGTGGRLEQVCCQRCLLAPARDAAA